VLKNLSVLLILLIGLSTSSWAKKSKSIVVVGLDKDAKKKVESLFKKLQSSRDVVGKDKIYEEIKKHGYYGQFYFLELYRKSMWRNLESYSLVWAKAAARKAVKHDSKALDVKLEEARSLLKKGEPSKAACKKMWPKMQALKTQLTVSSDGLVTAEKQKELRKKFEAHRVYYNRAASAAGEDGMDGLLQTMEYLGSSSESTFYKRSKSTFKSNFRQFYTVRPSEMSGIRDLNLMRAIMGCKALKVDPKLCSASRMHSQDMKEKKFFAHESPLAGKKSPQDRARLHGTKAGGENIHYHSNSSRKSFDANQSWWVHQ